MEVSGHQDLVSSPMRKEPMYSLMASWAPEPVKDFGERKTHQLSGNKPKFIYSVAYLLQQLGFPRSSLNITVVFK
jgi:hypothetical protein